MPKGLNAAKIDLQTKIYDAFNKILLATSNESNTNDSVNPSILIDDLSKDLTDAIHSYATEAKVVLTAVQTTTSLPVPVASTPPSATASAVVSSLIGGTGQGELK